MDILWAHTSAIGCIGLRQPPLYYGHSIRSHLVTGNVEEDLAKSLLQL